MTVKQLMTGRPSPLTNREFVQWASFLKVEQEEQEKARKKAESEAKMRR